MKLFARATGVLIALVAVLIAIETQVFAYSASKVRQVVGIQMAPELGPPAAVLEDNETPVTLLAAGDIVDCPEQPGLGNIFPSVFRALGLPSAYDLSDVAAADTAELARRWPDAPILAIGDLVYRSGTPTEFDQCFDPIWGDLKQRILPAPGNHEYKSRGAFGYYDYWGQRAGPKRRGYYALEAPGWLLLSLNSEIEAGPGSEQANWLQAQLDRAPEACILAFYHKPAISLKRRKDRQNAVDLFRRLQRNGTTLVVNGHNHFYERNRPLRADGTPDPRRGTLSFTVGTGGRTSAPLPRIYSTESAVFETTGLLRLQLDSGEVRWWYHDASDGAVLDQGTAPCNSARSSDAT